MKKQFIATSAIIAMMFSSGAFAQSAANNSAQTQTVGSTSQALGGALEYAPVSSSYVRYSASTAVAPGLSSSNDTCMGSTSAGVQGASFGVSIGTTWHDDNCKMLKNSREMWNMGYRGAAIKLLCTDPDNRYALESTGVDCGESKADWEKNGSKIAVVVRPPVQVPSVAQVAKPAVITTPQAAVVEQHAADIIAADQALKASQVASK